MCCNDAGGRQDRCGSVSYVSLWCYHRLAAQHIHAQGGAMAWVRQLQRQLASPSVHPSWWAGVSRCDRPSVRASPVPLLLPHCCFSCRAWRSFLAPCRARSRACNGNTPRSAVSSLCGRQQQQQQQFSTLMGLIDADCGSSSWAAPRVHVQSTSACAAAPAAPAPGCSPATAAAAAALLAGRQGCRHTGGPCVCGRRLLHTREAVEGRLVQA